jgi:serine/threonine-protein kinase
MSVDPPDHDLPTEAVSPTMLPDSYTPSPVDLSSTALDAPGFDDRYEERAVIGVGGMGEVRLSRDSRIGRDVAVKVMRAEAARTDDAVGRFLREARVQGQLEHPAIVPVYDLGVGPEGAPFFTMKRLRGHTLAQILASDEAASAYTSRKLLTEFANVCLGVEFAHTRGVLHRDLKPGNIMLGDFGEVYVLDWGIAKVAGVTEAGDSETIAPDLGEVDTMKTAAGSVLGTPGYMAPEQLRGRVGELDARTDVYALGAILFEILTRARLHEPASVSSVVQSTLDGVDARPSVRMPGIEVAPELEAICVRATALDPVDRYTSVRDMHSDLERYLDGDRDLERRRQLASEHAAAARIAAAVGTHDERLRAVQEASCALALDPEHSGAMAIIAQLVLEPPEDTPPEVERAIDDQIESRIKAEARIGGTVYMSALALSPFYVWMGVRDWTLVVVLNLVVVLLGGLALRYSYSKGPTVWWFHYVSVTTGSVLFFLVARIFGPLLLAPVVVVVGTVTFLVYPKIKRWYVVGVGVTGIVVPFVLETAGVIARSYRFEGGALIIEPNMLAFPEVPTLVFLLGSSIVMLLVCAIMIATVSDHQHASERRIHMQAWYVRHLVAPSDEG